MKIGVISDIHAHFAPLKCAMDLFESHDVTQIICAGDLVDGGWDDEAVIDYMRSSQIVSVRGNHDRGRLTDQIDHVPYDGGDIDHEMNEYRWKYLNSLPQTCEFSWHDVEVLLAHGAPWSDIQHVFPNASLELLSQVQDATTSDVVILGHTHIPMKTKYKNKWIFNPGALCGNREDLKSTCGILTLPQIQFDVFDVKTGQSVEVETRIINDDAG